MRFIVHRSTFIYMVIVDAHALPAVDDTFRAKTVPVSYSKWSQTVFFMTYELVKRYDQSVGTVFVCMSSYLLHFKLMPEIHSYKLDASGYCGKPVGRSFAKY